MLNGFARKISGLDFEYHSCIPGLRESILVRATSGRDMMEWETSIVPEKMTENTHFCLDSSPRIRSGLRKDGSCC